MSGLSVSIKEINTSSNSNSNTQATSYGFIGIIVGGFVILSLSIYILYHHKTRKSLYISGIAEEINILDIQSVLPGAKSIANDESNNEQVIIFDTNTNAKRSYIKCNNKSNSVIFRNSKIQLKWKPIVSFSKSSSIINELMKKRNNNNNVPEGYREFHGFLIPTTSSIETYEHKPQYNTHTLGEGGTTLIMKTKPTKEIREV